VVVRSLKFIAPAQVAKRSVRAWSSHDRGHRECRAIGVACARAAHDEVVGDGQRWLKDLKPALGAQIAASGK